MENKRGVRVELIKNDKFKTNVIGVFFSTKLERDTVSKNALIPAVLRRGCSKYPTMKDISIALENLYGARFDCGISKKGETQILRFYGEAINKKYLEDEENVTIKLANIIKNIIFEPIMKNDEFNKDYLEQEKNKLKDIIESRKNDKVSYAVERCYEIMTEGEPYSLYEYGSIEDVYAVTNRELVLAYKEMIKNYQVDIVVSGDIEQDEFEKIVELFNFDEREGYLIDEITPVIPTKTKDIKEELGVNQGKLSLGYRTNISPKSEDYFKMLVYNGILGGGVQSKLFQNVREKGGLAYYAFSRIDRFKGVMVISAGIEKEKYNIALDTITAQVEDMRKGNITKEEYQTTLKTIENSLNSMRDEQFSMLDFYYGHKLIGSDMTLSELINKTKEVTIEDVVEIAQKVKLDTIYFLG